MKRTKAVIGCLIVIALTILQIMGLGTALAPEGTRESINSIKAFHSLERDSLDAIVFGTSHAWKGFDPRVAREEFGLNIYNYAGNGQGFNTTFMFIQDAFRTQHPKAILIDTYTVDSLIKDINMEGQIYYSRAVSDFPGKRSFLRECFGNRPDRYVSYYLPIVMFHDNWVNLKESSFAVERKKGYYLNTMGYDEDTVCTAIQLDLSLLDSQIGISPESLSILDEIVELCEENDCIPIFYTCPYYGMYEYIDAMQDYANSHMCYYYNLFDAIDEMGLNGETDFRDAAHLNDSGARKVALYLGKIVRDLIEEKEQQ